MLLVWFDTLRSFGLKTYCLLPFLKLYFPFGILHDNWWYYVMLLNPVNIIFVMVFFFFHLYPLIEDQDIVWWLYYVMLLNPVNIILIRVFSLLCLSAY